MKTHGPEGKRVEKNKGGGVERDLDTSRGTLSSKLITRQGTSFFVAAICEKEIGRKRSSEEEKARRERCR